MFRMQLVSCGQIGQDLEALSTEPRRVDDDSWVGLGIQSLDVKKFTYWNFSTTMNNYNYNPL